MGNKTIVGVNELACVAVLIPIEKLDSNFGKRIPKQDETMSAETKEKFNELIDESKKHGGAGATMVGFKYFAVLIDGKKWKDNGKSFFDWCNEKGYDPKVADKAVIIDKRYMEGGLYEGVVVDIPPQYIDDAIRGLILKYCKEVNVTQILESGILMFEGELYPDIKATVMYNRGFIGGGICHNIAFVSEYPTRDYIRVLGNIESSIKDWIQEHKDVYKHSA